MIDVSQSVEHDHPHALEFLRKDCTNVVEYFRRRLPEQIMTVRELFDLVVTDADGIRRELENDGGNAEVQSSSEGVVNMDPDYAMIEAYLEKVFETMVSFAIVLRSHTVAM